MKKLNQKAFLMAEAIVVGLFIMTLFTYIYSNLIPLLAKYESREKYEDVSLTYDANLIRNAILLDIQRNPYNDTENKIFGGLASSSYIYYDESSNSICDKLVLNEYCNSLLSKTYLNVEAIIATHYRTTEIKKHTDDFTRAIADYIEIIPEYSSTVGSAFDSYRRLIIVFKDGRMANIELII